MPNETISKLLARRARIRYAGLVVLLIIAASIFLDRYGAFGYPGDDWQTFDKQSMTVVRVSDGDTIVVHPTGKPETRVRLLGIDAPELESSDHWSSEAAKYTTARLKDRVITLRLDGTQSRDKYGRLLAYVYVTDGDNLNLDLVRDGQAYADRMHKHSLRSQFETAEAEARKKDRGLWKEVRDDQQPQWRQRWLADLRARRQATVAN